MPHFWVMAGELISSLNYNKKPDQALRVWFFIMHISLLQTSANCSATNTHQALRQYA